MSCEQYWHLVDQTMKLLAWFFLVSIPSFLVGMAVMTWLRRKEERK